MNVIRIVTAPDIEPIDTTFMETHSRANFEASELPLIELYITAARRACEQRMNRSLITQTIEIALDDWPIDRSASINWTNSAFPGGYSGGFFFFNRTGEIRLLQGPVQSLVSFTSMDPLPPMAPLAVPTSVYQVDLASARPRIGLVPGQSWPSLPAPGTYLPIKVRYVAGFGDNPEDVPPGCRIWIAMLAAAMYENREINAEKAMLELPFIDGLLDPERVHAI